MSDFRELAPRPPGAPPPPEPLPVVHRTKVAVACESCRGRRVKVRVLITLCFELAADAHAAASAMVQDRNAGHAARKHLTAFMQYHPWYSPSSRRRPLKSWRRTKLHSMRSFGISRLRAPNMLLRCWNPSALIKRVASGQWCSILPNIVVYQMIPRPH
jgi:hypothetical protein